MRILHVVTLLSPDGAFGGPVRVADNQAVELRARGHDVVLAAGRTGYGAAPPAALNGTPLRLFDVQRLLPGTPAYSGTTSVGLLRWLRGASHTVDLVHIHLARDLITLPAAAMVRSAGVPYVVQPHGMVIASKNPLAPALDTLMTRRVLRDAGAVLHLTEQERVGLLSVAGPDIRLRPLRNGVPAVAEQRAAPARPQALFCARLQARKRPLLFVEMARTLLDDGVDAEFVLVGPDGGEGAAVSAAIAEHGDSTRLRWEGPLDPSRTLERMAAASLLVLPSVDEPYPMAVLEAMSVGRPVIVVDSCGLAESVQAYGCGLVVDSSLPQLVAATRRLLTEPATREPMAARAAQAAVRHFGMAAVVDDLEAAYAAALAGKARPARP